MQEVLLYTQNPGPRLAYIARLIFSDILQCTCTLTDNREAFKYATTSIRVQYGGEPQNTHPVFVIPSSGFLEETRIRPIAPTVFYHLDLPCFFGEQPETEDLPFDLLAMAFYLAARYEEYLPFEPDAHGRFPARQSLAFAHGFLDLPLIDCWAYRLAALLRKKFPTFCPPADGYTFLPTIDIDLAWAYLEKPLWKHLAGIAGDCLRQNRMRLLLRLRVWLGQQPDSFDRSDLLHTLHQNHQLSSVTFFLFSQRPGGKDPNIHPGNVRFQHLIQKIAQQSQPGLHPSYHTLEYPDRIAAEKAALEGVIGCPLHKSRQHFIRFRLPDTYRTLLVAGIREDYSMGYPDAIGYRASLARPFLWFDLEKNEVSPLTVFPFQVMDVTLKQYLGLSPEKALDQIALLVQRTQSVNGQFISIWHNSSFAAEWGWEGWETVYDGLLQVASASNK